MSTATSAVSARSEATAWAARIAADRRTLYLDTETTGLDSAAQLVDIAIIDHTGTPLLDTLVRPTCAIPADATAIHGITDSLVADAPGWPQVYPAVAALLASASQVIVYNADFDLRIINQVNRQAGLDALRLTCGWECAMRRYAEYAGERHQRLGGWRWHKLVTAAERLGVQPTQRHRALEDAGLCRSVVLAMASGG